ncbi:MAG: hypothetical protein ACR2JO_12340 [Mycobacteriales bacterium]
MPTTRFSAEPDAVVGSVLDTFYLDGVFCEDASIKGRHRAGPVGRSVDSLPLSGAPSDVAAPESQPWVAAAAQEMISVLAAPR